MNVRFLSAVSVTAILLAGGTAYAQGEATGQGAEAAGGVQEIIVTANRREQNLQDVGISIAAFGGDQLKSMNVNTGADIANITPNIEVVRSYASPGFNTQITIRGVGQPDFQDTTEAVATAYVDEFYMVGAGQADFLSFDIERVEVARGPQGTIQGRNSTAGSINYYTNKPKLDALKGEASVTLGERGLVRTTGYLNVPVGSMIAIRGAFSTDTSNGYVRNINPSGLWAKGGVGKYRAGRVQVLMQPNERFSVNFKAELGKMGPVAGGNEEGIQVGPIAGKVGTYRLPTDAYGQNQANTGAGAKYVVNSDTNNELFAKLQHYLMTANYEASDQLSFVALAGWLKNHKGEVEDCDHTPRPMCLFSNDSTSKHWTTELRALYNLDNFRLTTGVNYLKQKLDVQAVTPLFFDAATSPFATGLYGQYFRDKQDLKSWALFGQVEYDFTSQFTLIAGVRYTKDKKSIDSYDVASYGGLPFNTAKPNTLDQFLALAPLIIANASNTTVLNRATNGNGALFNKGLIGANVQLNYKPTDDLLVYASYRRGVKSGGFMTGNVDGTPANLRKYAHETNNAFELGFKSTVFDGRARLNGAFFYYDYNNMQNTSLIGITNVITNNDTTVYGGELELTANPIDGLTISAGLGLVHSKVQDIFNPTGAVAALQDNRLPLAPKFTGNYLIRYGWEALDGEMYVQTSGRGRTAMFRDSLNNPSIRIQGNFSADASIGYNSGDNRWSASLWVTNLLDSNREINAFDLTGVGNSGEVVYQQPRWFGGTITIRM